MFYVYVYFSVDLSVYPQVYLSMSITLLISLITVLFPSHSFILFPPINVLPLNRRHQNPWAIRVILSNRLPGFSTNIKSAKIIQQRFLK